MSDLSLHSTEAYKQMIEVEIGEEIEMKKASSILHFLHLNCLSIQSEKELKSVLVLLLDLLLKVNELKERKDSVFENRLDCFLSTLLSNFQHFLTSHESDGTSFANIELYQSILREYVRIPRNNNFLSKISSYGLNFSKIFPKLVCLTTHLKLEST